METQNRLELQIKQVSKFRIKLELLLSDFKKTKMRCLQLCQKLNRDLPNISHYQQMQFNCTRKLNTLDILGVIKLKQELISKLSQISQQQRDMIYEDKKSSFKKKVNTPSILSRDQKINQQVGPFQIPNYNSKAQSNQSKIDSLADYILSLGKSMKMLRNCIIGQWQWNQQNFYKYEPQYIQTLRKIEQFKMRDQQLIQIVEQRYQKQLQTILSKGQKKQERNQPDYYILKISKKIVQRGQNKDKGFQIQKQYHPISMIQPKRKTVNKKVPLQKINEEKPIEKFELPNFSSDSSLDLHVKSFQKHLSQTQSRNGNNRLLDNNQSDQLSQNDNYVYMVKRISPQKANASILSSISSLRSMRKKVFNDDIWDEFEKI